MIIYNVKTDNKKKMTDCLNCEHFDRKNKKCNGLGKNCFIMDKTGTLIDPVTGLPVKGVKNGNNN